MTLVDRATGLSVLSHDTVIADLKRLMKTVLTAVVPEDHVRHLQRESDRAFMILEAASVEEVILHRLKLMMPTLNSDEKERIFSFEGPCGSFSNRIRVAQGLGIMDRGMRRRVEVVKELRNLGAHCHAEITFDIPEVRAAVAQLFEAKDGEHIKRWDRDEIRTIFGLSVVCMMADISGTPFKTPSELYQFAAARRVAQPPA